MTRPASLGLSMFGKPRDQDATRKRHEAFVPEVRPVVEAVWYYSLHASCPDKDADDIQKTWWQPVAESLLNQSLRADGGSLAENTLTVQQHAELWTLRMPGSPCLMQMLFAQRKQVHQQEDFLLAVFDRAHRLAQLMERFLPEPLWSALQEAVSSVDASHIGLLGEDVVAEVTARACGNLAEWPGHNVFESVHAHLHVLVSELTARMLTLMPGIGSRAVMSLWPAVAASLLLPVSEQVASLHVRFPSESWWQDQQRQDVWTPLCLPLPPSITWESLRLGGVGAALQLHASVLQTSIDGSLGAAEDLSEGLQLLAQLSVVVEQFTGTAHCPDLLRTTPA